MASQKFGREGYLTNMDGLQFMTSLKDSCADIVFLDPPFNLGKDYGITSHIEIQSPTSYELYMRHLLGEACRVVKPGGAVFLYHLPYWATRLATSLAPPLEFRHWIAIAMKNGFVRGRRLYPAHYALLYYTHGKPSRFRRPRLKPQTCRHCGNLVKNYGGYTSIIRKKGLNLSDFWDDLSPVRHLNKKHRSANQLPLTLTNRVVEIAGRTSGVLVDPFIGTGTSLVSAVTHGMTFVGNDLSRKSISVSLKRLNSL